MPISRLDPENSAQNSHVPLFCSILSPWTVHGKFLHLCGSHSWFMKNRCETDARAVCVDHCPHILKPRNQANARLSMYRETFGGTVALSTRENLKMFTSSGCTWDLKAAKNAFSLPLKKENHFNEYVKCKHHDICKQKLC